MSARPVAFVVDAEPRDVVRALLPRRFAMRAHELPAEPFDLEDRALVALDVVDGPAPSRATILAAARGVPLVVRIALDAPAELAYLAELARVADVRRAPASGWALLNDDQRALLDALAGGITLTAAAARLGWSRRTATRRLAETRALLGATTTAELLHAVPRRSGAR